MAAPGVHDARTITQGHALAGKSRWDRRGRDASTPDRQAPVIPGDAGIQGSPSPQAARSRKRFRHSAGVRVVWRLNSLRKLAVSL